MTRKVSVRKILEKNFNEISKNVEKLFAHLFFIEVMLTKNLALFERDVLPNIDVILICFNVMNPLAPQEIEKEVAFKILDISSCK